MNINASPQTLFEFQNKRHLDENFDDINMLDSENEADKENIMVFTSKKSHLKFEEPPTKRIRFTEKSGINKATSNILTEKSLASQDSNDNINKGLLTPKLSKPSPLSTPQVVETLASLSYSSWSQTSSGLHSQHQVSVKRILHSNNKEVKKLFSGLSPKRLTQEETLPSPIRESLKTTKTNNFGKIDFTEKGKLYTNFSDLHSESFYDNKFSNENLDTSNLTHHHHVDEYLPYEMPFAFIHNDDFCDDLMSKPFIHENEFKEKNDDKNYFHNLSDDNNTVDDEELPELVREDQQDSEEQSLTQGDEDVNKLYLPFLSSIPQNPCYESMKQITSSLLPPLNIPECDFNISQTTPTANIFDIDNSNSNLDTNFCVSSFNFPVSNSIIYNENGQKNSSKSTFSTSEELGIPALIPKGVSYEDTTVYETWLQSDMHDKNLINLKQQMVNKNKGYNFLWWYPESSFGEIDAEFIGKM